MNLEEVIPKKWYNIFPDLDSPIEPPLDPKTKKAIKLEYLKEILPKEIIKQELFLGKYKTNRLIKIPEKVRDFYSIYRPTPLVRAKRFEKRLKTPAKIYFKREDVSPVGSHKLNTSIPQVYYSNKEGVEIIVSDTGAGQWGSAVALSSSFFGMKSIIFMIKKSYDDKPYRVMMMKLFGAEVYPSPSNITKSGREALKNKKNLSGSLGIGMSEAFEFVKENENAKLALGCMSNYAVMHQTVIGNECMKQFEIEDIKPDVMIGCVGGGSNFAGFVYPFLKKMKSTEFIAVESNAVPVFTKGSYRYDYQDFQGLMPMIKMYTLGNKFIPPKIHAGGLRYHGKTPTLSYLVNRKVVNAISYSQKEVFEAGKMFALTEGIIPAPESSHAIKATIDKALECKKSNEKKTIVFNLSGHGLLDLKSY